MISASVSPRGGMREGNFVSSPGIPFDVAPRTSTKTRYDKMNVAAAT